MSELAAVDEALFARGGEGDPRLGEIVRAGPVQPLKSGETASATVALIGLADDRGVGNGGGRRGAAEGPRELRRWLYQMTAGGGGELANLRLFDLGDAAPGDSASGVRSIEEVHALAEESIRAALVAGARVIVLGGGRDGASASHSGLLRAISPHGKLASINLSARCGVAEPRDGKSITSETPFRRLKNRWDERFSLVEFGIQMQHNSRADIEWAHAQGWPILELRRLREDGAERRFLRQLSRARTSAEALAVSLDLGSVEAASAPGVSSPCPDGFTPAELFSCARDAGKESAVRLLDAMECAPPLDENGRTARLGAAAIWSFLAGACESR